MSTSDTNERRIMDTRAELEALCERLKLPKPRYEAAGLPGDGTLRYKAAVYVGEWRAWSGEHADERKAVEEGAQLMLQALLKAVDAQSRAQGAAEEASGGGGGAGGAAGEGASAAHSQKYRIPVKRGVAPSSSPPPSELGSKGFWRGGGGAWDRPKEAAAAAAVDTAGDDGEKERPAPVEVPPPKHTAAFYRAAKCKLNEVCMKERLPPPQYQSETLGPCHMPVWKSALEIWGRRFANEAPFKGKKEAEGDVALQALEFREPGLMMREHGALAYEQQPATAPPVVTPPAAAFAAGGSTPIDLGGSAGGGPRGEETPGGPKIEPAAVGGAAAGSATKELGPGRRRAGAPTVGEVAPVGSIEKVMAHVRGAQCVVIADCGGGFDELQELMESDAMADDGEVAVRVLSVEAKPKRGEQSAVLACDSDHRLLRLTGPSSRGASASTAALVLLGLVGMELCAQDEEAVHVLMLSALPEAWSACTALSTWSARARVQINAVAGASADALCNVMSQL